MNTSHDPNHYKPSGPNWSRINQWLLWIGLASAVAWMFYRHNAHLLQLLPFLVILACPLMHIFGHGGHGGHEGYGENDNRERPGTQDRSTSANRERDASRQSPADPHAGHHH